MIAMNETNNTKPVIGISMGDPAGIGPEIIVKALSSAEVYAACRPVVVGDAGVMRQAVQLLSKDLKIHPVQSIPEARFEYGTIDVYDLHNVDLSKLQYGVVSAMAGGAAFEQIFTKNIGGLLGTRRKGGQQLAHVEHAAPADGHDCLGAEVFALPVQVFKDFRVGLGLPGIIQTQQLQPFFTCIPDAFF
jgi:hypothetical protein